MTRNALGTSKSFSIDYNSLNCIGAPKSEMDESAVMGVCTYQASAWQTIGSMVILLKYDGLEVKTLLRDVE